MVAIHVAKTTLSQLLARVEASEEIVMAPGKQPIARLAPCLPAPAQRRFGALRGVIITGPEFFEPLADPELEAWE